MTRFVVLAAALLFVVSSGAAAQSKPASQKTMVARGIVKSVAANSVTVNTGKQDMTFTVDDTTKLIAKGAASKTAAAKSAGKSLTLSDVVKDGNQVTVNYHDMGGGTLHAASIRVR